ncbi:MAG: hypothetical protein ACK5P7_10120 [Bdellovibrio sp.]|jgi:hypothetical protein
MKTVSKMIGALTLLIGFTAGAHEFHTDEFCSQMTADLCVHIGYDKGPVSTEASQFMVHFTATTTDLAALDHVALELWMDMGNGHGHGSAPVQIRRLNNDHFLATEAWFVMPGTWQVRINFTHNGVKDQIVIPMQVAE